MVCYSKFFKNSFFSFSILSLILVFPVQASKQLAAHVIGDAAADLIYINVSNEVVIQAGDGAGGFLAPVTLSLNFDPTNIEFADFNSDGFNDLVAFDTDGLLSLSLNDTADDFLDEDFLSINVQFLEDVADIQIGDLNDDGFIDIALAINGLLNGRVAILYGDGAGGFDPLVEIDISGLLVGATSLDLSDLNADNTVDLIIKDLLGNVHLLLSDGLGSYQAPSVLAGILPTGDIYFTDLDHDQVPDMIVLDKLLGILTIRLGNGDGSFLSGVGVSVGLTPTDLVAVDLNLDGNKDLAVVNVGDNSINVLMGDGLGGVVELVGQLLDDLLGIIPALGLPSKIVSQDFNSDCRLDVGIWNDLTQSFIIQLNQTGPAPSDLIFCSVFDF